MAGWVDNLNGTWTITPTITVPDVVKEKYEQIRKGINFVFFTTVSQMTDEEFATFFLIGKVTDRSEPELSGRTITPQFSFDRLWIEFKKLWVSAKVRKIDSADAGDTEGLAVVVDAPPAP